jgi:hypothetical protein
MSMYGQRGGTSATAGRKAETIEATFPDGSVRRKRVFSGQRAMTLCASEEFGEIVTAWEDLPIAQAHLARVNGDDWPVQFAAIARPAHDNPNNDGTETEAQREARIESRR